MRRIGAGAVVVATALVVSAVPAQATPQGQTSLGSVKVVRGNQPMTLEPLAQCDVTGTQDNSSQGAAVRNVASFGSGTTKCTQDTANKTAKMEATGSKFAFTALVPYGGPRIELANYTASCAASTNGTQASFQFSGLRGVTVDTPIPQNTAVLVGPADKPQAKVIFNEITLAQPSDGSVSINMMHIVLFPNGGPLSGDVLVGAAACSPVK
ncbi:hypothetical protein GCM10010174_54380 [Kutzneria viridogrisea]